MADNRNGSWTEAKSDGIGSIWYRSGAVAGTTTVTATSSARGVMRVSMADYSGIMSSAPLLSAACTSATGRTTLTTSPTASVPQGSLVFAGAMNAVGGVKASSGTISGVPATLRSQASGSTGTIVGEDVLSADSGPQRATFHWSTPVDSRGCLAAFAPAQPPHPPTPGRTPAEILDLSDWSLTLPVGSGTATTVMQPDLDTYRSQYFDTDAGGDGVLMTAPVQGVPTSGSTHTRSELRETASNGTLPFGWSTGSGTNVMTATEAVTHLPGGDGALGFAQIHGPGSTWYLILEAKGNGDGTATLAVKDKTGKANGRIIDTHYVMGTKFGLTVSAVNGVVTIAYNGVQKLATTNAMAGAYFKIGAYNQSGGDYGQVDVSGLTVVHR